MNYSYPLGADSDDRLFQYQCLAFRLAYRFSVHEPMELTGSGVFTVEQALGWAERLADEVLDG